MADVTVTVKGKDELSQVLMPAFDALKRKAEELGVSTDRLNGFGSQTKTERVQSVTDLQHQIAQKRIEQVHTHYDELRHSSIKGMNPKEQLDRALSIKSGKEKEAEEIGKIEKEALEETKKIVHLLSDSEKISRERKQIDDKEHKLGDGKGILEKLLKERGDAHKGMLGAESIAEFAEQKKLHDSKAKQIESMLGGHEQGRAHEMIAAAASGNMLGVIAAMGGTAAIGAIAIATIKGAGEKLEGATPAYGRLAAFNQSGITGRNKFETELRQGYDGRFGGHIGGGTQMLHQYGIEDKEVAEHAVKLALSTGISAHVTKRAQQELVFEKGTGAELAPLAQFERQDKYHKESVDNATEMIEVLTSFKDSSLKKDDLVLLGEKIKISSSLMAYQMQHGETTDTRAIYSAMAAFDMMGGKGKGQYAGDMIGAVMGGAGEGGGDRAMMMKMRAAKKSHPEMNPAELMDLIESGQDWNYITTLGQQANKMYKPGSVGARGLQKMLTPGLDPESRKRYYGSLENEGVVNTLTGKNYDKIKGTEESQKELKQQYDKLASDVSQTLTKSMDNAVNIWTLFFGKWASSLASNPIPVVDASKNPSNKVPGH